MKVTRVFLRYNNAMDDATTASFVEPFSHAESTTTHSVREHHFRLESVPQLYLTSVVRRTVDYLQLHRVISTVAELAPKCLGWAVSYQRSWN